MPTDLAHFPFIVKVCGVTTVDDAQAALDAGANALGFNFYSKSPRYISREAAAQLIPRLRGDFLRVGVFVHPTQNELVATSAAACLDVVQIHGDFASPNLSQAVWRALNPGIVPPPDASVEAWLLDSATPLFGGSGQTFDWSLAATFPYRSIIAGGLDGANVTAAIRVAGPWGVDSCSRLESSPGRKDHARMTAFVASALKAFHAKQEVTI